MFHLVFVDDNPDFLDLISQDLEDDAFRVTTLLDQSGRPLKTALVSLRPDAIFIDIYLVSTTVELLCRELQSDPQTRDIPLYLISFSERVEIERLARTLSVTGALTKPITKQAIKELLSL